MRLLIAVCWTASAWAFALPITLRTRPSHLHARPSSNPVIQPPASAQPGSNSTSLLHRLRSKLRRPIRGSRYVDSNSTILTPSDAALAVGVKPTMEASKATWQTAWKVHRFLLQYVLHSRVWDKCQMKDSKLALAVLWWKAIAGNDSSSPVHDHRLSYDLLPPISRAIVHPVFSKFYPRLHHANVEIRTAYLDKAVANIISDICNHHQNNTTAESTKNSHSTPINIRLIIMGGGYDTRSFKFVEHHKIYSDNPPSPLQRKRRKWGGKNPLNILPPSHHYNLECYELDLPQIVHTKQKLIESRLSQRRPWLKNSQISSSSNPTLLSIDLNNLNQTRTVLEDIVSNNNPSNGLPTANIILFEGVMIYLNEGVPHQLLELCNDVLNNDANRININCSSGNESLHNYLCFADRLDNIPGGDEELARIEMESTGWKLEDWLSKPGLARHMGVASLVR